MRNVRILVVAALAACLGGCASVGSSTRMSDKAEPVNLSQRVSVDLNQEHQVIDNFGASDCWSMQFVGGWSLENRNRLADLLFSTTEGIGLSCWRFNLGGGKKLEDIGDPWRTVETFEVAEGQYDWSRQGNEQWFLGAAKARGVDQFVAFVNSPPARMTRNGLTRCSEGLGGPSNLKEGYEGQYARYLADILDHFRTHPDLSQQIDFDWVSPVNEPQWDWNGRGQEGNRASNPAIKAIFVALGAELERRGLATKILGVESGHMASMRLADVFTVLKYAEPYGDYLDVFCNDPDVSRYMGNVIGWHSYLCDGLPYQLLSQRTKLREKLKEYPDWRFWQTEYCLMQGPEGNSGGGRDLGMKTALDVVRVIHHDLVLTNVSAWQWWLGVSNADYKDGLIYTDYRKKDDSETIHPSKLLWAFGNYSRFIRPGARRVELTGADDIYGLLGSAYKSASGNELIVVFANMKFEDVPVSLNVQGLAPERTVKTFMPYTTSDKEDLAAGPAVSADAVYTVPSRSVVTLVGTF